MFLRCLLLVCLAGCYRVPLAENPRSVPSAPAPKEEKKTSPEIALPLQFDIQPLPEPHQYKVDLQWSQATARAEGWRLSRAQEGQSTKQLTTGGEDLRAWTDSSVQDGQTYRYTLWRVQDGQVIWDSEVTVRTPQDRVIDTLISENEISLDGRLFLSRGAILRPHGSLRLEVAELRSEGAIVESFEKGAHPERHSQSGRSGGLIEIKAGRAAGQLTLFSRGEDGKIGFDGSRGRDGNPGVDGDDARYEKAFRAPCNLMSGLPFLNFVDNEKQLEAAYQKISEHFPPEHPEWRRLWKCTRSETAGTAGENGGRGQDGGNGGNGGNTSPLFVEIPDAKDLELQVVHEPGRGMPGGIGGGCGRGTPAGRRGQPAPWNICPAVAIPEAKHGAHGADGSPGLPGKDGQIAPHCLRLGNDVRGDCAAVKALMSLASTSE